MLESSEITGIDPFYGCLVTQHDGLGGAGIARLLAVFGSARAVYEAAPEALKDALPKLRAATLASLAEGPDLRAWEALRADCAARGITLVAPDTPDYPEPLRALDAPPPLLYLRGAWRPEDARAVAIVGTREPTDYGREAAHALARDLARAGCAIVSGLAVGVDAAAHAAAMAAGGRTIAVIGCGLNIPYPTENLDLRARIEQQGVVISEFPPDAEPRAAFFPRRNRIISALSRAVIVVEAGTRSGALITAAHAREQGRALFAVPGLIFSPASAGTLALLREGVPPATCAADVLAALDPAVDSTVATAPVREALPPRVSKPSRKHSSKPARKQSPARPPKRPNPHSAPRSVVTTHAESGGDSAPWDPLLHLWDGEDACGMDALAARAEDRGVWARGAAAAALPEALLRLELRGLVRRLPGGTYRVTGRGA